MAINVKFRKAIEGENFFRDFNEQSAEWCNYYQPSFSGMTWGNREFSFAPIIIPAWQRKAPGDDEYKNIGEHEVFHVHGHTGQDKKESTLPQKRSNLDNDNQLGHSNATQPENGNYHIYSCTGAQTMEEYLGVNVTREIPVPEPKQTPESKEALPLAKFRQTANVSQVFDQAAKGNWDNVFYILEYQPTIINEIRPHVDLEESGTLLQYAVQQNNVGAVQTLLDNKANVNLKNGLQCSPLFFCKNDSPIKQILEKAGAKEANACAYKNPGFLLQTMCKVAKDYPRYGEHTNHKLAAALIEKKDCPVTGLTEHGETVLHLAVQAQNRLLLTRLLKRSDIDIHAKNKQGHTALDIAKQSANEELITLLESKIAQNRRQTAGQVSLVTSAFAAIVLITLEIAASGYESAWATQALAAEPGLGKIGATVEDILIACSLIAVPYLLYCVFTCFKTSCATASNDDTGEAKTKTCSN